MCSTIERFDLREDGSEDPVFGPHGVLRPVVGRRGWPIGLEQRRCHTSRDFVVGVTRIPTMHRVYASMATVISTLTHLKVTGSRA
jgi:hypothetical protein